MRLTKFRIKNFKSIIDTGYCFFGSDMTILIGKNESGKTATLEALRYFNRSFHKAPEDAFPLDAPGQEPSVEIWMRLERDEIDTLVNEGGTQLSEKAADYLLTYGIGMIKNSRGEYSLNDECIDALFREESGPGTFQEQIKHIKTAKDKLQDLLKGPRVPSIDFESGQENIQREAKELIRVVKSYLPSIKDEQQQVEAVEAVRTIIKESKRLTEPHEFVQTALSEPDRFMVARFVEAALNHLPNFIYFTEFADILPFEIPVNYLKENQAVLDFAKIAGLDLDLFMEIQDVQRRINYLNRHSAVISGDFMGHWGQNKIELIVKSEGNKLLFGVQESGKTDFYKIEQRSKGFQWFLSFYLRLNAQKGKSNVILIDEPGMHLHAKAQKEIIKVLEDKIVSESQVIFSTHCPYLINTQRLDRVRLVTKDSERGTVISEDIHSHGEDESLIPVMTAMGGEKLITISLPEKQNVIVAGAADFYWCKAMTMSLKDMDLEDINLLPATDIDQVVQLVSLMIGYAREFQVLLNNNNEGYQIRRQLKDRFGLGNEKIVYISKKPDFATEDLFAPEDFDTYILRDQRVDDQSVLNSDYLRDHAMNRMMLARKFYDHAQKGTEQVNLSATTIAAFRKLFERIIGTFHAVPVAEEAPEKNEKPAEKTPEEKTKRRPLFAFLSGKK